MKARKKAGEKSSNNRRAYPKKRGDQSCPHNGACAQLTQSGQDEQRGVDKDQVDYKNQTPQQVSAHDKTQCTLSCRPRPSSKWDGGKDW